MPFARSVPLARSVPFGAARPLALFYVAAIFLGAALGGGCRSTTTPYVSDPSCAKDLPEDPLDLVSLADELVDQTPPALPRVDRALAALSQAEKKGHPQPFEVYWRLARGCFLMTELLPNKNQCRAYAAQGEAWAQKALALDPDQVQGHYYLALNRAKLAEADNKLSLVKVMLQDAEKAAELDPAFDQAGPYRFMGKVYITAPSWPVSVGNPGKAVDVLEQAVEIAPTPLNRLFLGQAYFHDDEPEQALEQIQRALQEANRQGTFINPRWRQEARDYLQRLGHSETQG